MKRCSSCRELLPWSEFGAYRASRDGLWHYCRSCQSSKARAAYTRRKTGVRLREPVADGFRRCPDCGEVQPLENFPRNRSGRDGRGGYCKPCHNARGRAAKEKVGGSRQYHLRRRYGIGQADVDAMLAEQGGCCAVCGKPGPEHVDHDHTTGRVRGMLCFNCNQALGNVRDDEHVLLRLVDYLRRSRDAG